MIEKKKRLGELLLEEGLIDRFQLQAALAEQKKWGGRLGKHLIELGILSEELLVKVLSKLLALPSVDVGRLTVARGVVEYVPVRTAEKFNLLPIGIEEAPGGRKTIIVAMGDPTNLAALDELRFTTGCSVRPVVSGDSSIERAIRLYYHGVSGGPPTAGNNRARTQAKVSGADEMVIMSKGDAVKFQMSDQGAIPASAPEDVSSLPSGALLPVISPTAPNDETGRRVNALLRVLVRNNLLSEEEFLAELAKG